MPKEELSEIELSPELKEKLVHAAQRVIQHAKLLQVDAGEYGPNPPTNVWNKADAKFGSIDKTNMFGTHVDDRSLVEETWLWDDRYGLQKPERYAPVIAENMSRLLTEVAGDDLDMVRLRGEEIKSIYKRANDFEQESSDKYHFMQGMDHTV